MKRILFVSNSYPIQPRIKKISSIFELLGYECLYVAWNLTEDIAENNDSTFIYNSKVRYGHPIQKLIDSIRFKKIIKEIILEKNITLLYAFSYDSMFCCSSLKGVKIIYDVADLALINIPCIDVLLQFAEKRNSKRADVILLGSRFFENEYKKWFDKCYVIENLPNFTYQPLMRTASKKKRITFLGIIRYLEVLKNLIIATSEIENVEIKFYGYGKDEEQLKDFIASSKFNHVSFFGLYSEADLPKIYADSDFIWAVYPCKGLNERKAISNKYFESIYYKVPAIFDKASEVGRLAQQNKTGFIVNGYDVNDIKNSIIENLIQEYDFADKTVLPFSDYINTFSAILKERI